MDGIWYDGNINDRKIYNNISFFTRLFVGFEGWLQIIDFVLLDERDNVVPESLHLFSLGFIKIDPNFNSIECLMDSFGFGRDEPDSINSLVVIVVFSQEIKD